VSNNTSDVSNNPNSSLSVSVWNTGGFKSNRGAIFDSVKCFDVSVLLKTFLTEEDITNFDCPQGFLFFAEPALREAGADQVKGRGARAAY
jgi:hypothetical protein